MINFSKFREIAEHLYERLTPRNEADIDVRFILANERTLLAWVRTGLALIGGGVAVGMLGGTSDHFIVGIGAVVMGGLLNLIGYMRYHAADKAIRTGKLPPTGVAGLLVVIGVSVFAAAVVLVIRFAMAAR